MEIASDQEDSGLLYSNRGRNTSVAYTKYHITKKNMIFIVISVCLIALYLLAMQQTSKAFSLKHSVKQIVRPTYRIAIITDLDKRSSTIEGGDKGTFQAYMRIGHLTAHYKDNMRENFPNSPQSFSIEWEKDLTSYVSGHNEQGRGMECSELVYYKGVLYTGDDRTGLVYELTRPHPGGLAIPRYTLMEGSGVTNKGFKIEWMTVKGDKLYVGSFGKEYTNSDGSVKNRNNLWVKIIDEEGRITHADWTHQYDAMRKATGTSFPGYMIHESVEWSAVHQKWFILPRRVSTLPYDDVSDEIRGSNTMLIASEDFNNVEVRYITPLTPTRGFSTFKFVPGSGDNIIVALKSEEKEQAGTQTTHVTVFDLAGNILLAETEIDGGYKYEGIEFIDDWLETNN